MINYKCVMKSHVEESLIVPIKTGQKLSLALLPVAVALLSIAAYAQLNAAAKNKARNKIKSKPHVLYITQAKGFKHSVLPESEKVMQELAAQHGFEVTVSQQAEQSLTQENLKNFDVVMFYTTGELPLSKEQKAAFLNFIESGKAFIGVHSATDTFYQWPQYGEMIGGYFAAHPWGKFEATIKVDDRQHPATRHLPETFKLDDEIYTFKEFRPGLVKVLMYLDTTGLDLTQKGLEKVNA